MYLKIENPSMIDYEVLIRFFLFVLSNYDE